MPYAPKTFRVPGQPRRPSEQHRGTSAERGYDAAWRRVRDKRRLLNPFCQDCEERGRIECMEIVDHVIPVDVDPTLRLELDNTRSLCRSCHAIKTNADAKRYGKGGAR